MSKKEPKCTWCNNQATKLDYREIDTIVSKIPSCDECFKLSTLVLINRMTEPTIKLIKNIEVFEINYGGCLYGVHVDCTEQREIISITTSCYIGDISEKTINNLKKIVDKIDH